jgi:hypothetical protein
LSKNVIAKARCSKTFIQKGRPAAPNRRRVGHREPRAEIICHIFASESIAKLKILPGHCCLQEEDEHKLRKSETDRLVT